MAQELVNATLLLCTNRECVNDIIRGVMDVYRDSLYSYNTIVKRFGVYLKPIHIVVKKSSNGVKVYHYYGKYWYKVVYSKGKVRWIYIGREKPVPEIPNPPINPLTVIKVVGGKGDKACIFIENIHEWEKVYQYFAEIVKKIKCVEVDAIAKDLRVWEKLT